ncbi:hypothetical protein HanIR_Chr06g0285681 [Helianthus annuus]|nr:hypothetical protein HanIR_Chr06g0285681 [Helianthus annuus]
MSDGSTVVNRSIRLTRSTHRVNSVNSAQVRVNSVRVWSNQSRQSTEANSSVRVSRFETYYEAVQLTRSN